MRLAHGAVALAALAFLASCASDGKLRGFVGYRPPLLPVKFVADNTGVRIEGEASLVTPIGQFSLGAELPIAQDNGSLRVVIRDDRKGTDEVFDVEWSDSLAITLNGRNKLSVTRDMLILDISQGGTYQLTVNVPPSLDQRAVELPVRGGIRLNDAPRVLPVADEFRQTTRAYASTADLSRACRQNFGSEFRIANWVDIQQALRRGISTDKIFSEGSVSITRGGIEYYGSGRHYIASRPIHDGYLVHEWSIGNVYALGSWSAEYPILCFAP